MSKAKEFLSFKQCATIMVEMYQDYFNRTRNMTIRKQLEIDQDIVKSYKLNYPDVTDDEILAYECKLFYLSDDVNLKFDLLMERDVCKKDFINMIFYPTYNFFLRAPYDCCGIKDLLNFAEYNGLLSGIEEEGWFNSEPLKKSDCEIIVENVKKFLDSYLN